MSCIKITTKYTIVIDNDEYDNWFCEQLEQQITGGWLPEPYVLIIDKWKCAINKMYGIKSISSKHFNMLGQLWTELNKHPDDTEMEYNAKY